MTRLRDTGARAVPYRYEDASGKIHRIRPDARTILRDQRIAGLRKILAETGTDLADAPDDALAAAAPALGLSVNTLKRYRYAAWKRREEAR